MLASPIFTLLIETKSLFDSKGNLVYQTYEKPDARHAVYVNKKLAELRDASSELKRRGRIFSHVGYELIPS